MSSRSDSPPPALLVRHVRDISVRADPNRWLVRSLWTFGVGAAAASPPIRIRPAETPSPHLLVLDDESRSGLHTHTLKAAILKRLALVPRPQSTVALRNVFRVRKATLVAALESLEQEGMTVRSAGGWSIARRVSATNRDELFERTQSTAGLLDPAVRHALARAGQGTVGDEHFREVFDAIGIY